MQKNTKETHLITGFSEAQDIIGTYGSSDTNNKYSDG